MCAPQFSTVTFVPLGRIEYRGCSYVRTRKYRQFNGQYNSSVRKALRLGYLHDIEAAVDQALNGDLSSGRAWSSDAAITEAAWLPDTWSGSSLMLRRYTLVRAVRPVPIDTITSRRPRGNPPKCNAKPADPRLTRARRASSATLLMR